MSYRFRSVLVTVMLCSGVVSASADAAKGLYGLPPVPRAEFNRIATQQGLSVFWTSDVDADGVPEPGEIVPVVLGRCEAPLVEDGRLTAAFETVYRRVVETLRRETVRKELDQARPTLVHTDTTGFTKAERRFVGIMIDVARLIEELFAAQQDVDELTPPAGHQSVLATDDPASRVMLHRNQGPWGAAPLTEGDPLCNAMSWFPARTWDTYPPGEPHTSALCDELRDHAEAKQLLDPFHVVRREGGALRVIPYHDAAIYGPTMKKVAAGLREAAGALAGTDEAALIRYLEAAARGFETNHWHDADEAWAAMNAGNSAWYLRVAPDEVYWDLCQSKAAFHVSFARIDARSLAWQEKLNPLRDALEKAIADAIGEAYAPRAVSFQMPDFIQIVLNAGDARSAMGATIGQSLPNWGPVAEEGRGRTVVMTNLYKDPDSLRTMRQKAASLLTAASMAHYSDDPTPDLVGIILHEAAHNLGPHSDYAIGGKGPREIFGGRMASLLEELKAQTAALFLLPVLVEAGALTLEEAHQSYTGAIAWAFGHISRGMKTPTGIPKTYSQLAAVQVGSLMEAGALRWELSEDAETGQPTGRFAIDYDKMPGAVATLMAEVGRIKATGDKAAAEALVTPYVEGDKKALVHMEEITQRQLAYPKATFLYTVEL